MCKTNTILSHRVCGDWELKAGMYNAETGQPLSAVAGEEPLTMRWGCGLDQGIYDNTILQGEWHG